MLSLDIFCTKFVVRLIIISWQWPTSLIKLIRMNKLPPGPASIEDNTHQQGKNTVHRSVDKLITEPDVVLMHAGEHLPAQGGRSEHGQQ